MGKTIYFVDDFDPLLLLDASCVAELAEKEGGEVVFVLSSFPLSAGEGTPLEKREAMMGAFFRSFGEGSPFRLYPLEKSRGKPLKSLLESLCGESRDPFTLFVRGEGLAAAQRALADLPCGLKGRMGVASIATENGGGSPSPKGKPLSPFDVPASIWGEIEEGRLYYIKTLSGLLQSEHRLNHSISVANLSYQIAKSNGLKKPEEAYVAGLFHDVGKHFSKEESRKIMGTRFPAYLDFPEWTFHQFVGEYLTEREFGIEDGDVLQAIQCHATGKKDMGTLDKIIYSADKIEPLRGYDSSDMIALCLDNCEKGFRKVLSENRAYLTGKGYKVDNPLTKGCFDCYLGEENERN